MIHRLSRWYFIFGHSPNTTGCPHVGIKCLPACTCYLLPVNGLSLSPSSFVPLSFSFHCLFIILFFACIVFRLPNYYSFSISRSSILVSSPIHGIILLVGDAFPIVLLMCYVTGRLCFLISHIRSYFFYSSVNLYGTPPLWRGFRDTTKKARRKAGF